MLGKTCLRVGAVLVVLTLAAAPARSQILFTPFINPFGGFGGGFGNGFYPIGSPYMPYGYGGGYGGGMPGYWGGYGGWSRTITTVTVPGFGATTGRNSDYVSSRPTMAPAVGLPANSPLLAVAWQPLAAPQTIPTLPTVVNNTATVVVRVPSATAKVWFEGVLTQQQGTRRNFVTPALSGPASYAVRAEWIDAQGHRRFGTQTIDVSPGGSVDVAFPVPR